MRRGGDHVRGLAGIDTMEVGLTSNKKQFLVSGSIAALVVVIGLGWATLRTHGAPSGAGKRHATSGAPADRSASDARSIPAAFEYPASRGSVPESIKFTYDEAHDRTRMSINLSVTLAGSSVYRTSGARLVLTSEFKGRSRPTDTNELSVVGAVSVTSSKPGILACSKPGVFTGDSTPCVTRFSSTTKTPYTSKKVSQTFKESLKFKLDTVNLLRLAQASAVTGSFGAAEFRLSPTQVAELREFAARMNPTPK